MKNNFEEQIVRVESIRQLHEIAGFDKPRHPLLTIIDYSGVSTILPVPKIKFACDFYSVNYKTNCSFSYGRKNFDHGEGTLLCTAPGQVITYERKEVKDNTEGWGLYFHADLIRNTSLGEKINEYTFFLYDENEALHLADHEKETLLSVLKQIEKEYNTNIDRFSQDLIVSSIEVLLNYCKRFYGRQFITRKNQNTDTIVKFEKFLSEYINSGKLKEKGIPSVKYCAENMNLSANYFSDLLKSETGKNCQEHIHFHILEKAKNMLLNPSLSVNEIADELGFEYPQYFSKLFKNKVGMAPGEYRSE